MRPQMTADNYALLTAFHEIRVNIVNSHTLTETPQLLTKNNGKNSKH